MKLKMYLFLICLLLVMFFPTFASVVEISPQILNVTRDATLNISVNNTESINISKVLVLIPSGFNLIGEIGTSVNSSLVENPTQTNPLIWSNKTIYGIINSSDTQYFWFKVLAPSSPSGTNFTFIVNLTYLNDTEEYFEINVTVNDVDAPMYYELSFSKPNNTRYSPGENYGFQIKWKDNVNVSHVIFSSNFNASINLIVPLFSGNEKEGIYVVNFSNLNASTYWFIWYSNDTSGNWNNTSNITYVILPASNIITVYVNGITTNYTVVENGTIVNITAIARGTIYLFKNNSFIKSDENRTEWNEVLNIGVYEFKLNVSSRDSNYESNSTGETVFVKVIYPRPRFKDLQAPSSTTYSPGASYTFKITFYSPAFPLNNITNVSFIFNNQIYYLSINNPQEGTYTFTIKDLAAGNYNWKFCARDTQGETNCTLGTLTIYQATPKLDILNVQDYAAPTNKTIIGVGCPSQLVCKLYLNGSELSQNYYELNTDKGGYYVFTFNTSGNANYSAASITKSMTVYPPRQIETTTTTLVETTTTTILEQQPSQPTSKVLQDIPPNTPTTFKIENPDLLKVAEIEITTVEDIKNVEVKVDIPLPTEIPVNFVEKNKVFLTYIKITTNVSNEKISSAKIRFKVEKLWIDANNIDPSKVFLYKLVDNNWVQLPTQKISEDANNIYYESSLSSFSIFVIAGEIKAGFPWHLVLILLVVIIIVAIIAYLFWPTPIGNEYEKLKQKWASGGLGK